ncbi:hypothetical protein [Indiicoccus explosivorum]|uniref:hypothetical protein n=1 Tax=Indiicoccus explosivorum TaxID=1917864 RepID=UPI000B43622C|nr:hypothetical protein [Indiicoccus explosivorum]
MSDEEVKIVRLNLHLKYIITIFVLVGCTIGGLALYDQEVAIKGLSAAGLLTSIVLAVVAILITLWDVAGQKNNIQDMKSSVEELKEVTAEIKSFVEQIDTQNRETIEDVIVLFENFQADSKGYVQKLIEATEKLGDLQGTDKSEAEIQSIKKELSSIQEDLSLAYNNFEKPSDLISIARRHSDLLNSSSSNLLVGKSNEEIEMIRKALKNIKYYNLNFKPLKEEDEND